MGSRPFVIVFGATSYVGRHVVRKLIQEKYEILAVSRNPLIAKIALLDVLDQISLLGFEDVAGYLGGTPAAIVNLAYPKDAPPYGAYAQNRQLFEVIHNLALKTACTRLIHVSTQAVFGYTPKHVPQVGPARGRFSDSYLDSKSHAERILLIKNRGAEYALAIVRLGNVIGPGSPAWIARLAQRILEGKPVGYHAGLGFSNATYVENAADYLCALVRSNHNELDSFGVFHHLAEFGPVPWRQILEKLSAVIGVDYVLQPSCHGAIELPLSMRLAGGLRKRYRRQMGSSLRRIGQALWSLGLPERVFESLRILARTPGEHVDGPAVAEDDRRLLQIMGSRALFEMHVLSAWHPPISLEGCLDEIGAWLKRAGYAIGVQ